MAIASEAGNARTAKLAVVVAAAAEEEEEVAVLAETAKDHGGMIIEEDDYEEVITSLSRSRSFLLSHIPDCADLCVLVNYIVCTLNVF